MRFDILTIFPQAFESYFETSIIKRALDKKIIKIKIYNLRKWAKDKHRTIDDKPYGGGPGMIFKIEPLYKAIQFFKKNKKSNKQKIILLTPSGKQFDQIMAKNFSKQDKIILICGHYEGFDCRIEKFIDEKISIGPYVLTGGELPAMSIVDAITRLIKGVINKESLKEESFGLVKDFEYPQYTRPEVFTFKEKSDRIKKLRVPKVLLSGNHAQINEWKQKNFKKKDL